jgi:hypothetical protein
LAIAQVHEFSVLSQVAEDVFFSARAIVVVV